MKSLWFETEDIEKEGGRSYKGKFFTFDVKEVWGV
jgi:hypothetical protein